MHDDSCGIICLVVLSTIATLLLVLHTQRLLGLAEQHTPQCQAAIIATQGGSDEFVHQLQVSRFFLSVPADTEKG